MEAWTSYVGPDPGLTLPPGLHKESVTFRAAKLCCAASSIRLPRRPRSRNSVEAGVDHDIDHAEGKKTKSAICSS